MENKRPNSAIILALAFLSAAVTSPIACAVFTAILILFCRDSQRAESGVDAFVLSVSYSILSTAFSALTSLGSLIGIHAISGLLSAVRSVVMGIADIAILIVGISAALTAVQGEIPAIPVVGGRFKGLSKEMTWE